MKRVEGVISLTQEGRFELVTDNGRVLHFMLAHNASIEPQDLPPLQREQRRLEVDYTEPGHIIGCLAHAMRTVDKSGKGTHR
jgi:hypothetical protein